MFKAIWKGFKWFFSVKEKTHNSVSRKHGFTHVKVNAHAEPIKVYGKPENQSADINETYDKMVELRQERYSTEREADTIEAAKKELWVPRGMTSDHLDHILVSCGFQKTIRQGDKLIHDPRLIQALNYGINMYAAKVASDLEAILLNDKQ
ncbi:hypothetical protein AH04_173 [Erwinia phage AH04]|uniref:Uncharacterized protein n=1 Tax=Erwinia phage AH04 TaxID=2869569 RepID=A0AAE8BQ48_9CAUD|nr:hypothetical protein PQC02_gp141 [Erwinia phage AH04]QZA70648.1 hypothetical protein AH04_173 [Erwinia phage AH04]